MFYHNCHKNDFLMIERLEVLFRFLVKYVKMYSFPIQTFIDKVLLLKKESIYSFICSKLIPFVVDYWYQYIHISLLSLCPASQVKKNQAHLLNREPLSWFCVSDLLFRSKRWELLRAVTLDDSQTPTPALHNTSVVVWNLYCVLVIIVRLY